MIQDYAENISFFVEGTICYVIYAHELIFYRDVEGKNVAGIARHPESPRAQFTDCPTSVFRGVPIVPGPITVPKKGVKQIYSDITPENTLKLRVKGAEFQSYQVILESNLTIERKLCISIAFIIIIPAFLLLLKFSGNS